MTIALFTSCTSTRKIYKQEVAQRFQEPTKASRLITRDDLNKLPITVANYLENCGWLGKEIPKNVHLEFSGKFSLKPGKYMNIKSEQYNWFDRPTRIFHMTNLLVSGRHRMDERGAFMLIKLLSRIKVVDAHGPEMNQAELVTYLNDMCIIAPGALIEAPIEWKTVDEHTVKATISEYGNTISALLYFNEKYELVNFTSNDRFATSDGKETEQIPWSTPMGDYIEMNGIKVPGYGEAVWNYPDRDFVYAKFDVKEVKWNLKQPVK